MRRGTAPMKLRRGTAPMNLRRDIWDPNGENVGVDRVGDAFGLNADACSKVRNDFSFLVFRERSETAFTHDGTEARWS